MAFDATETEILDSRRSFATTQLIFPSTLTKDKPVTFNVGWVGSDQLGETGIVAVTSLDATLTPLVGEFLLIKNGMRQVIVYVMGSRDVPVDLALSRRAFLALAGLYVPSIELVGRIVR